jgi:hypothetical protein
MSKIIPFGSFNPDRNSKVISSSMDPDDFGFQIGQEMIVHQVLPIPIQVQEADQVLTFICDVLYDNIAAIEHNPDYSEVTTHICSIDVSEVPKEYQDSVVTFIRNELHKRRLGSSNDDIDILKTPHPSCEHE